MVFRPAHAGRSSGQPGIVDSRSQNTLNSIAEELTASAPRLASRLSMFNRLAAGEPVPEEPRALTARRGFRPRRRGRRRLRRAARTGTGPMIVATAAMAVATAAMVAVMLVLGAVGHMPGGASRSASQCARLWLTMCSGR